MKTIESYLPVFQGFYGSDFDSSNTEEMQMENFEEDGVKVKYEDVKWDYADYKDRVAKECISSIWNYLKHDGFTLDIEFDSVYSPKEYNYVNDSINCTYKISEEDFQKLVDHCKNNLSEFNDYLIEKFTSYSGFSSYFERDPDKWFNDYLNEDYVDDGLANFQNAFASILDFYLTNEGYTYDTMYDDCLSEINYINYELPNENETVETENSNNELLSNHNSNINTDSNEVPNLEELKKQWQLQDKVVKDAKINIVTCGDCGSVLLHETEPEKDEIECPFCGFKDDISSFPDLFYKGFENNYKK